MSLILVPAYGRDYKSREAVLADWDANKDFLVQNISSPYNGRYTNKTICLGAGIKIVNIRYNSKLRFCVIKL